MTEPSAPPGPEEMPAPDAPAAAPPPPRPSRWLDRLTAALLVTAAAVAVLAAAPALLRAAGAPLPLPDARAPESTPPLDLRHAPPEILADPDKLFDPELDLDGDDLPGSAAFAIPHGKLGRVLGLLVLRERPADGARLVGEAKAGELVLVMKELGDWAYVKVQVDDNMVGGWAKKNGIAIR